MNRYSEIRMLMAFGWATGVCSQPVTLIFLCVTTFRLALVHPASCLTGTAAEVAAV